MKNNKLSADEKEYQEYLAREKYIMDEISKKKYAEIKRKELEDKIKQANEQLMNSEAKLMDSEAKLRESEEKAKQSEEKAKQSEEKVRKSEEKVEKLIKELLKAGISEEVISINTGLDIDEINKIKEGLDKR